jgi:cytochrome c556
MITRPEMSFRSIRVGGMRRMLCVAGLSLPALLPTAVHADNKDVVDYRMHIMHSLNEQSAALGQILSGVIPEKNAQAHLEALALTASTALKAFEPKVPGGESKAEVWSNWADFSKRMNEFARQTREAAKLSKEKGFSAAGPGIIDAMSSCKNCHDINREEKK